MALLPKAVKKRLITKDIAVLGLFVLFTALLYGRYLLKIDMFLLDDDSFNQRYPNLYYLAQMIKNGGISLWSFSYGLGADYIIPDPFSFLVALFGPDNTAYGIVVIQCLKVILAAQFFYLYLKELDMSLPVCVIGAFCFCVSGTTVALGMYSAYTNISVCLALLLWVFERCYKRNRWLYLLVPLVIFSVTLDIYYTTLYSLILSGYGTLRFVMDGCSFKECIKKIALVIGVVLLCYIVSFVKMYPSITNIVSSDRTSDIHENTNGFNWADIFRLVDFQTLKTAWLRFISPDIQGVQLEYYGANTYMDDPIFYCGLIMALAIPQAFLTNNRRKKICFAIALLLGVAYVIFPAITLASTGFVRYTFKMSGLFVTLIMIFVGVHGLEQIMERKANLTLLCSTAALLMAPFILLTITKDESVDYRFAIYAIIAIGIYILLFSSPYNANISSKLLLLIVCTEIFVMTYPNLNNPKAISIEQHNSSYYNDGTTKAIDLIKSIDSSEFFRVEKDYRSVGYCDSLAQGYFGVKSYSGGANINKSYSDFLNSLQMPLSNNDSRWVIGFNGYPQLNSLFNVKYMLTKTPYLSEYGFRPIKIIDGIYVWLNKNAIPLGTVFHNICSRSAFETLTSKEKRDILLKACILEDASNNRYMLNNISEDISDISSSEISSENGSLLPSDSTKYGQPIRFDILDRSQTLVVTFTISCLNRSENPDKVSRLNSTLSQGTIANIQVERNSENGSTPEIFRRQTLSIQEGTFEYTIEFSNCEANQLAINFVDPELITIDGLSISIVDSEQYYKGFVGNCTMLKNSAMQISSFANDKIQGSISLDEPGMMFFAIPYDPNWQCIINGKPFPLERVDINFIGLYLDSGNYEIELKYIANFIPAFISAGILFILALGVIIRAQIRKALNKTRNGEEA